MKKIIAIDDGMDEILSAAAEAVEAEAAEAEKQNPEADRERKPAGTSRGKKVKPVKKEGEKNNKK